METPLRSTAPLARSAKAPQAREAGSHPGVSNPAFDELLRKAKAGDHQAFAALVAESSVDVRRQPAPESAVVASSVIRPDLISLCMTSS